MAPDRELRSDSTPSAADDTSHEAASNGATTVKLNVTNVPEDLRQLVPLAVRCSAKVCRVPAGTLVERFSTAPEPMLSGTPGSVGRIEALGSMFGGWLIL